MKTRIYCCGCQRGVSARLTDGAEIYRHRKDLARLPFWKCDTCGNHVGCHHKTSTPTKPLGAIPTPELKRARSYIHDILDPLWKRKLVTRAYVYSRMASALKLQAYHTAEIRSVEEARIAYRAAQAIARSVDPKGNAK